MTGGERFAARRLATWSFLFEKFVVPELTTAQRRRLLGLRRQMRDAATTGPEGYAGVEAVDLLCDPLRNGLDPFELPAEGRPPGD